MSRREDEHAHEQEHADGYGPTPGIIGQHDDYLTRNVANPEAMEPHRFRVAVTG